MVKIDKTERHNIAISFDVLTIFFGSVFSFARSTAFSFIRSSTVSEKSFAIASSAVMSGIDEPFSHLEIVLSEYEILSPRSDCLSPLAILNSFMFFAIFLSI